MKQRNKHSYDTTAIQQRLLPILSSIDKVCREHNLRYYLWAGTQLGAVRHAGFIPWDDDADIAMPRADYEVLLSHAAEWLPSPLVLANHRTTERYPHYFARVQDRGTTMIIRKHLGYAEGIHIDIFPLDNVPDGAFARKVHFSRLGALHRLLYIASRSPKKDNKRHKALYYKFMQRIIKQPNILRAIDRVIRLHNSKATLHCSDSFYGSEDFVAHKTLGEPKTYTFEGVELLGVENAERYLSDKYGDYMTLPPESARRQHSVDFIDFDLPFEQFDMKSIAD